MFRKSIMILLFIPFLIMACAATQTPLKKKLLTNSTPQFNGYITKIYQPIQPMYKPVESNFKASMSINFAGNKNSSTEKFTISLKITGTYKIEKLGDLLTWEYKYINITADGKTSKLKGSPVLCRMLMDRFGKIQEIELMHPGLCVPNISQKKRDEIVGVFRSLHELFYPPLLMKPVRSGDPIAKIYNVFSKINTELHKDFKLYHNLKYIINGWSFFNKSKIIVASIDEIVYITEGDFDFQSKIDGYRLYDAETFQIIDGNLLLVAVSNPSSKNKFSGRILIHQSAKLKK